ncbi:MAG: YgiT-type zinc finger protein [Gammaproteobacteria bacterium]|jgi:YgiT-type zinc finger domain-containing protein|nr:YgiT-type zinc finger protein [Gammaproteobacteria bacterium]
MKPACPLSAGRREPSRTTFTAKLGFGVVVVRYVPALVCDQCGEEWIEDPVAAALEAIVDDGSHQTEAGGGHGLAGARRLMQAIAPERPIQPRPATAAHHPRPLRDGQLGRKVAGW